MEDLTDIKNIWRTAKVNKIPSVEQAVRFIKRYRFKQLVKKAALVSIMLLMTILMIQATIYGSNSSTARIGEICIFIGYSILIVSNANSLRRAFNQVNRSNQEFIEYLKQAQRGRLYFYEKVQPFTFVIMTLGLFLYVFESVRGDFVLMLKVYSGMTVILIVMWFILRPLVNKKRTKKLKETIARLEVLQGDL